MVQTEYRAKLAMPVVTTFVCLVCGLIFAAINLHLPGQWGYVNEVRLYQGQWWGLLTDAFVHFQILHIAFNLYWAWILGGAMERAIGSPWMAAFIVVSALVSSGLQLMTGELGVGLSGVGYAIFGFCWMARPRWPQLAQVVTPQTVQLFFAWGVFCIFLTYSHIMAIGNGAHLGGLLFGAALGGAVERKGGARIGFVSTAIVLAAASVVPLFYNPLSEAWVGTKAYQAQQAGQPQKAIPLYRRVVEMDPSAAWAWHNLTMGYLETGDQASARKSLEEYRRLKPQEAQRLADAYGLSR